MGYINFLLVFFLSLLVNSSSICNDPIPLNRQQHKSPFYCSSCSIFIDEHITAPTLQFELPSLTKLTGIFVQGYNKDQRQNLNTGSYFLEYRRTQDGPWLAYGKRRQRKLLVDRHRLFFQKDNNRNASNVSHTFLPHIIARQIRIIFLTPSISTCAILEVYGCPSHNLPVSARFSLKSVINPDLKYDGVLTNTTAQGGLGMLSDGDVNQFVHWAPSYEPILLMFAFDSIKEFQSINLDVKCSLLITSRCTLKVNVGILEIVASSHIWTNHFHAISIDSNRYDDNVTITQLILSVPKTKGQFVIIQINTRDGLALSEVTFNNWNENDEQNIVPSSIYLEANLNRLELSAFATLSKETVGHHKLSYLLLCIVILCTLLIMFLLTSCIVKQKKLVNIDILPEEAEQSVTISITNSINGEQIPNRSQLDLYSSPESKLENRNDGFMSYPIEPINSQKIVNESAKATVRVLNPNKQLKTLRYSLLNFHSIYDHLPEIDSSSIIIMQNLGAQNNHRCFYSQYGENKSCVILHEQEHNEFFNLSKLIDHKNIVSCLGYVNILTERCLLVSEHSQLNLFEYCQTMTTENGNTLPTLMKFLNDIVSALVHLESLSIITRDLTLPNCLLFDDKTIKLSDYAKCDDRYASRYVRQMPIRWLPGDIVTGDEPWSTQTNTFMFGTLIFELFHLGSCIPYKNLNDDEVLQLFNDLWQHSKQNSIEPSVVCFTTYFPRPILCNDRLYAFIERCLSWSSSDRPSFREISLYLDEIRAVPSQ